MKDRMRGLKWARQFYYGDRINIPFTRTYICNLISRIAGGDPKQYRSRASKMISEAKLMGQIVENKERKRYYIFVDNK